MNRLSLVLSHVAILSTPLATAFSQEDAVSSEDEIFELSPFTINAAEDTGYRAKHSLSGSRLKLSLDDLSVPIDIITPEVLSDFNINQQEDLFDIVSNMESRDDSFLSGVYESGASYSIRGFIGVKSLRNFMGGNMTFDSYNSTRFIASKGPNAILFGSGPGGGSVSFFTKRYNVGSKDRTNVKFSYDSEGSLRSELSMNKGLIEDKLGVSVALFDDQKEYSIKPSGEDRNGYYISATYHPFENTKITSSWEERAEHVYRPASDYTTLIDNHSAWEGFGSPGISGALTGNTGNLIYPDDTTDRADVRQLGLARQGSTKLTLADGEIVDLRNTGATTLPTAANAPAGQRSIPDSLWPKDVGPTGLNGGAEVHSTAWDVNIEQKVNDDFYLMLAFGKNDSTRDQFQHRIRSLHRDPNLNLPDGSLNPHYGEYYLELNNVNYFDRSNETETITATAAYELDLEERNKYFGKHNFALMFQEYAELNTNIRQSVLLTQTPDPSYELTNVNDASGRLNIRHYLGSDPALFSESNTMPDYRYIRNEGFELDGYRWETQDGVGGSGWRSVETTSKMFVVQSNFFRSRLITSLGYRMEDVDQFVVNFANNPLMENRQTVLEHYTKAEAEAPGFQPVQTNNIRPTSLPSIPWESVSGLSKNLGVIFKVTPKIAILANKAQNISGNPGRNGVFGIPLPYEDGRSRDIGLRFNLFEDKMRVEYNRYETGVNNQATQATGGGIRAPYTDAEDIWLMMIQAGSGERNVFLNSENWDTRDFVSKGHELTITGDPVRGLNLRAAISYNEQEASNLGGTFMPWWREHAAEMEAFVLANPEAINLEDTDTTPDPARVRWQSAQNLLRLQEDLEGAPIINRPLWTAKILAKYRFQDGMMKGHETGLNVAWRGKMKSQYFRLADGSSDLDDPFYTLATSKVNVFWNYSKKLKIADRDVNWKVQLNVNNLFNSRNTIERNFFTTVNGDKDAEVIATGLIRSDPRRIAITNSFSF